MRASRKTSDHTKVNGVHYTPPDLAAFLADATISIVRKSANSIRVLDPACGNGRLLRAIAEAVPQPIRRRMILVGYETDATELANAGKALSDLGVAEVVLHNRDFLSEPVTEQYDIVISNPPYVRTQVMGAKRAQALAGKFGLTDRVDLYHAFVIGMTAALKTGGVIGLLTSNRFLTIKSGASLREMFASQFEIEAIYDLGDTKLFSAAVLPVILVARKGKTAVSGAFHRIYEQRNSVEPASVNRSSILEALRDTDLIGTVETPSGVFQIDRGTLAMRPEAWSLSTSANARWLKAVLRAQVATISDLAKVRVGIKSTADEVFVRDDWASLPDAIRPEATLIRPLLTHRESARWLPLANRPKSVLYPHSTNHGKRLAINLDKYPCARAYFEMHRKRLTRRKYVIDGGREWYELWVPHNPDDWAKPKIAYPDISEDPRFFFDASGAIIQGDCYWITLKDGVDPDWLLLMLAVANSTFITKYYDVVFHNKLYAGRRRFMTQYVAKFPLPDLRSAIARRIVGEVSKVLKAVKANAAAERRINGLVWEVFGMGEEIAWQRN